MRTNSTKVAIAGPSPRRRALMTISFVAAIGIFFSDNPVKPQPVLSTSAPASMLSHVAGEHPAHSSSATAG